MSFEPATIAAQYGPNADAYAANFGGNLEAIDFDRAVLAAVLAGATPGGVVLDVGCGPGQGVAFAQARGLSAIGVDVTPEMLTVARTRVGAPMVQADLRSLPFAAHSFDAVIAWYALLHVPRASMAGTLAGIRRVMRTGAPLIIGLHGGSHDVTEPSGISWCQYQSGELARLLDAVGFRSVITRTRPPLAHELQVTTKLIASALR